MAKLPRIYVESCCFIDAAKDAIGIAEDSRKDDVWYLQKILKAHQDKVVEVFTSVLTIAECTHAGQNTERRVRDIFDRLLMSGQNCVLIQPTPFIAADARDLRWKHNIALGGADGLHVASGLARHCQEFLTTDGKILARGEQIVALGMRVSRPSGTILLPAEYRQGNMLDDNVTPIRRATGTDEV